MRDAGLGVVRFNFLYKGKKSGRPDPMPRLMDTSAAVVAHVRAELKPSRQIIGGRSMGGRAASMLAADGYSADGLLLLAYPLHPAGQPESCETRTCRASACRYSASTERATSSAHAR